MSVQVVIAEAISVTHTNISQTPPKCIFKILPHFRNTVHHLAPKQLCWQPCWGNYEVGKRTRDGTFIQPEEELGITCSGKPPPCKAARELRQSAILLISGHHYNKNKFTTHDSPPAGPVPRRGSLHVLQHCPNVCQNLLSALGQKGSALLQNLAALCNSLVFTW